MDKPGYRPPYVHIKGNEYVLDRGEIRNTFSKFGNIKKLYINPEGNYANLFFDQPESVEACLQYNGVNGLTVVPGNSNFLKKPHIKSRQNDDLNSSVSTISNTGSAAMEDMISYSGDLVDSQGRAVVFLKADDGEIFVNLRDVERVGFKLYQRKYFENTRILDKDLRKEIEAKIFHYGMECVLEANRVLTENEIIDMFARVKAKVFNDEPKPAASLAQNRQIISPQSTNNYRLSLESSTPPPSGNNSFKKISFDTDVGYQRDRRSTSISRTVSTGNNFQNGQEQQSRNFQPTSRERNHRESRFDQKGPRSSRERTPVRESRSSVVSQKEYVPNFHEQRSATSEKPSNIFAKVEQPAPSSSFEQKLTSRVKPANTFAKVEQESPKAPVSNVSRTENVFQVDRVKLDKGLFELKVTYLCEKRIFFAQLLKNYNIVEEIMLHVNSEDLLLPVIEKPTKNMLVVVEFEELWYRGVVLQEHRIPGAAMVELLDYGNKEEIKGNIRQMSEEMKKIPAQAMRFTLTVHSTVDISKLEIDQDIEVVVNKQFDNHETTYLVDIKRILKSDEQVEPTLVETQPPKNEKPAPAPAAKKCFMQIAKPNVKIVPGEMVFIVNHTDDKLIVKNKEMAALTKKIISLVASMEKEPVSDPKVGQYVLCNCFDFGDGLFRASIKEIRGELASLTLIDFSIEETLPLTSLRNIDEGLASLPPAQIEINYPPLKNVTDEGLALLSTLITEKAKIKSTEANGQIDFTVDGELLSNKIAPKLRPPKSDAIPSPSNKEPAVTNIVEPVKAKPVATMGKNTEDVKTFFRDMPFEEPKAGLNFFFCYSYNGASLTIINASPEYIELIELVSVEKPADTEPYKPAQFEMCLAKFDDGSWCRAMATGDSDEKVEVKFVDYGNIHKVDGKDIRKLPEEMKTIPILGINAQIEGFDITDAVEKRLKELIPDNELLQVDVKVGRKVQHCMNYSVELPSIYDILKDEGLII